jgi:glycosyltransferase involved in cell wall biosynthesis
MKNNIKMAIVSSYSVSCGNAAFTRVLHDSIEYFYNNIEVEVIELDLNLLQSTVREIRRKADNHIEDICARLKLYDFVNIQMEAGLYGTLPVDIIWRFKKLVTANKNISVTLHSPRLVGSANSWNRSAIKKFFTFNPKGGIKDFLVGIYSDIHIKINKKIVLSAIKNNARLIVHTYRSKKQILDFFSYSKVDVHPLKMVPYDYKKNYKTYEKICFEAGLGKEDVVIGMFGYISAYKGHLDALNALKHLPKNYKLLIFGRQHPQTLRSNGQVDHYLDLLQTKITKDESIKGRVLFMGELNDSDFLDVVSSVDISWLPYYENGQDGSGIASICLDLSARVLCSSSFAFDELFKLVEYKNVRRVDIGNKLEIALKTMMFMRSEKTQGPFSDESRYSIKSQADNYVKGSMA